MNIYQTNTKFGNNQGRFILSMKSQLILIDMAPSRV